MHPHSSALRHSSMQRNLHCIRSIELCKFYYLDVEKILEEERKLVRGREERLVGEIVWREEIKKYERDKDIEEKQRMQQGKLKV